MTPEDKAFVFHLAMVLASLTFMVAVVLGAVFCNGINN